MGKCIWETVLRSGFQSKNDRTAQILFHRIKAGSRKKKIDIINAMNPEWRDLYDDLSE
jgi:predicted GIY-YIG superfamily endonuclease